MSARRRKLAILTLLLPAVLPLLPAWILVLQPQMANASTEIVPDAPDAPVPLSPLGIGKEGEYKDYFRIDRGCRLEVYGPGELVFYVRAHVPAETAALPETVWVAAYGVAGLADQRWTLSVSPSPVSRYSDGRAGRPTGGKRVAVDIPEGLHQLTVQGASDTGVPVYAIFYYEGPPIPDVLPSAEPPRAEPTPPAAAPKKNPWQLNADFSLEIIYDDNICRYSDATLMDFRTGARPELFAIETYDDLIFSPTLQVELDRREFLFRKRTRFRLGYRRWEYLRNNVKTNEEVNLRLRQYARRYDYIEFRYVYAPNSYIKELGDRPPFVSRSEPREYMHFYITRNQFTLAYYWRALRWMKLKVEGERTLRFYNRPFLENDLWEWNGEINAYLDYRRLDFWLSYKYSNVEARAYDSVGETRENSDNDSDGSYEKDAYRVRVTYKPRRSPYNPRGDSQSFLGRARELIYGAGAQIDRGLVTLKTYAVHVEVSYNRQFYTSERPLDVDPLHVGRLDQMKQLRLGWSSSSLWKKISLEAGARFTVRTAEAPAGLIGEDDPSEEKDYTGNRYWLAIDYPLN